MIGASLSEPHTSVVNGEFLSMYYRGDDDDDRNADGGAGGATSVHLVLRVPTSRSHATSLDTWTQDSYVSFPVRYRQHSHMHMYIEMGTRTQATPSKRAREEVPHLRNRRDAGEKAMELVQSHSQRIPSSPAYCWCALITTWTCTYGFA